MKLVTPAADAISRVGASAVLPKDFPSEAADKYLASDVIQKAVAQGATWEDTLDCGSPVELSGSAPSALNLNSHNWAGYQYQGVEEPDYAYYLQSSMIWTIPAAVSTPSGGPDAVSIWPGVGTGDSEYDPLIQAGTQSYYYSGVPVTNAWFEVYPLDPYEIPLPSFPAGAGDDFGVVVTGHATGIFLFTLCNYTANKCISAEEDRDAAHFSGQTVEWIVERPQYATGAYQQLDPFGSLEILGAEAAEMQGNGINWDSFYGGSVPLDPAVSINKFTMTSCNGATTLAHPGSFTGGGDFTVNWDDHGINESC
ncbi:G1 family glutamic endopeptidase [Cnuibacter sp. UC19_7]|uniref:G1 family glutamic endopeptidase n=1 Tax=Cnuibacter sp. UC19_7 TaxID=3350166 RepID=UPI00366EFAE4